MTRAHDWREAWRRLAQRVGRLRPGSGHPVSLAALDAEYASGNWDHFGEPPEAPRYRTLAQIVRTWGQRPRVLDVGCGSGQFAREFKAGELGDYLGVDLSGEALRRARNLGLPHGQFVAADFESWRPDRPWDVIVFNEVIGYAVRPDRLVRDFGGWLSPGGVVVISYFRSGNFEAIWRRVLAEWEVRFATEIAGPAGRVWDIRVLSRAPDSRARGGDHRSAPAHRGPARNDLPPCAAS